MTGSTILLEGAVVRVGVAIDTARKLQAGVLGLLVQTLGQVAFGAVDFGVQSREGILTLGVVEAGDILPPGRVVAGLAILAELALVKVFVARNARLRKPEKTPIQVLLLDQFLPVRLDARCLVAILALDGGMLAIQRIAGLLVVKFLLRGLPADQLELFSVVFGVAARTIVIGIIPLHHGRVISLVGGEPLSDFGVALQAPESPAGSEKTVAAGALHDARDGLMSFGDGSRRNLPMQVMRSADEQEKQCRERKENSASRGDSPSPTHFVCPLSHRWPRVVNLPFSYDAGAKHPGRSWRSHTPVVKSSSRSL